MRQITTIIVNYNDFENTNRLINELVDYHVISHIIIIDNASTDNSIERLKQVSLQKVISIYAETNLGYARGNNLGIKYAIKELSADYLMIANPDISVTEDTLEKLIEKLDFLETEKVGLLTARMIGSKTYSGCGVWKQPTWGNQICNNLLLLKKVVGDRTYYKEKELNGKICKVDVVAGSFFICKATTLQNIDYFDESTFLYGEENIIAMRLKSKGYTNYICNDLSYQHEHSASIDKNIDKLQKKFMWLHDSMVYYNKCYLHTNVLQNVLYDVSFYVGLYVHLFIKKVLRK